MTDCSKNPKESLDDGIQVAMIFWVTNSKGVDVIVYNKRWKWQDVRESLNTYVVFRFPSPTNTEGFTRY